MTERDRRTIAIASQAIAALAILAAIAWIVLAEDKGIAIAGGIIAALLTRVAMVEVPDWLDERSDSDGAP